MKKTVQITNLTRRNSSRNGNPRWLVDLSDGTQYLTAVDAACAYGLGNAENLPPNRVEVTIERGVIEYVAPVHPTQC